ncbi:hypothetical protein QTN25_007414 [Entamoeba marina]
MKLFLLLTLVLSVAANNDRYSAFLYITYYVVTLLIIGIVLLSGLSIVVYLIRKKSKEYRQISGYVETKHYDSYVIEDQIGDLGCVSNEYGDIEGDIKMDLQPLLKLKTKE